MLKRSTGIFTVILFLLFMLSACGSSGKGLFPAESGYTDEQLLLGSVNRFAGVVIAGKETKIEKESGKTVDSLKVSVGDTVKKGDVLFTYDGSQAQYDYEKAEMELDQMRISLDSYASQRAELEAEKAKAPASEQLSYTIQIQEIDTSIRETEYNISLKEKDLQSMKDGLGDLNVYSPVNGTIQSVNKAELESGGDDDSGNEEIENDFSDPGSSSQPFIMITQTNAFRIKAFINEENMRSLSAGDPVTVRSRIDESTWEGTVAEIESDNPQQDQSGFYEGDDSEVTTSSRYPFYVDLKNSDGLMLGQHVYVELYIEASELPENAEDASGEEFPEEDFAEVDDFLPDNGLEGEIHENQVDMIEGEN